MVLLRIYALLFQQYYITLRSLEVIFDVFVWSWVNVLVFGLVDVFLTRELHAPSAHYLLLGMMLWVVVSVAQYAVSVDALWNVWSRNLSNIFITPLSTAEYISAQLFSSFLKAMLAFVPVAMLTAWVFDFSILDMGWGNMVLSFLNLMFFGWTLGLMILALVFAYGTRIQALTWGLIILFQPLSAAFFPVDILPRSLQIVAYTLSPTYVFEAARRALAVPSLQVEFHAFALFLNLLYLAVALWFFLFMLRYSRRTGQFARNDAGF